MHSTRMGIGGWRRKGRLILGRVLLSIPRLGEIFNEAFSKDIAFLSAWHFIRNNNLAGDYLEFGVFRGDSFCAALRSARNIFRGVDKAKYPKFFAFDGFRGLPKTPSMQCANNVFHPGDFLGTRREFEKTLRSVKHGFSIDIAEGGFDRILTKKLVKKLKLKRAAFINIDCDLYESTLKVLDFVTPLLETGTVLYFDDWYSFAGSLKCGEAKACGEWLKQKKQFELVEYRNVGISGKMFLVNLKNHRCV